MLNIFLCEDNTRERQIFENYINNSLQRNELEGKIVESTNNPNLIIESLKLNKKSNRIYFLDINLGSTMNGVLLAKKIREIDSDGYIIFITTHSELVLLTFEYKVRALDFILKDNYRKIKDRIDQCILIAKSEYANKFNNNNDNVKVITIKSGPKTFNIRENEIEFLETMEEEHKIKINTSDQQIEFYGTLKEIEKELDTELFYRCHRSCIVNIKQIKEVDKNNLVIKTKSGYSCFVSRRNVKGLFERWTY
ncbi:LytR/AlgR family response regulator transcription factor [Clostridium thailandense]|uniref:LytR/AlgR family response regulator transcription factor n=1 Tax=Clostridium thailandense TaxID=2794346 RepID=UPI0039895FF1